MKIQKSKPISAFGGINFVLEYLHDNKIDKLFNENLPPLSTQSRYSWSDIIQSLLSIYLCGGDCIEDLQTHLKQHFKNNPFINIPSPDTVLRRLSQLTEQNNECRTKRGIVTHKYNSNELLNELNIKLLKKLGSFNADELTLDYDNTIIFNEKSDSKMTYKRQPGYQPGICTINEEQILYIENRNGNSDAKAFQPETLFRLFDLLNKNNIKKIDNFRADAASYQFDVVRLLEKNVKNFFIGCKNSYVSKFFNQVTNWVKLSDINGEIMEVGDMIITPFQQQCKKAKIAPKEYRLIKTVAW